MFNSLLTVIGAAGGCVKELKLLHVVVVVLEKYRYSLLHSSGGTQHFLMQ